MAVVLSVILVLMLGGLLFMSSRWSRRRARRGVAALTTLTGRPVIMWCQVPRRWRTSVEVKGTIKTVTAEYVDLSTDVEGLSALARRFVLDGRLLRVPITNLDEVVCDGQTLHLRT